VRQVGVPLLHGDLHLLLVLRECRQHRLQHLVDIRVVEQLRRQGDAGGRQRGLHVPRGVGVPQRTEDGTRDVQRREQRRGVLGEGSHGDLALTPFESGEHPQIQELAGERLVVSAGSTASPQA
jgi:hypothetical protein